MGKLQGIHTVVHYSSEKTGLIKRLINAEVRFDNYFSVVGHQADIRLHFWQQAGCCLVLWDPSPSDVLAFHSISAVNPVEIPDESLEERGHLLFVARKVAKAASSWSLRDQHVVMYQLAHLHQKVVEPVVSMKLYLTEVSADDFEIAHVGQLPQ